MRMNRMFTFTLWAGLALVMVACQEEGPAYDEDATGEAAVVDTELAEDARLSDDVPIGEPEVFTNGKTEPAHPIKPVAYDEIPPASEAIQETPPLPGNSSDVDSEYPEQEQPPVR